MVYVDDYAFGSLDRVCGAVSEGPEVGERGLGVSTRVGQSVGIEQRYGDVYARLAGPKDIAGSFTVADILLVVVQRTVDVAPGTVDRAERVASSTTANGRSPGACPVDRHIVMLSKSVEEPGRDGVDAFSKT